jgi:hypothetical protein
MKFTGVLLLGALLQTTATTPQTTADGVRAFEEGDYATAVRILRPLAEDILREDALAQFYMARLYEQGYGTPVDLVRALSTSMQRGRYMGRSRKRPTCAAPPFSAHSTNRRTKSATCSSRLACSTGSRRRPSRSRQATQSGLNLAPPSLRSRVRHVGSNMGSG